MQRILFCLFALYAITGCVTDNATWYEERCLRLGFEKGSENFNNCIERDVEWLEENRRRREVSGP